jgi:N-6 DNA Methylase
VPPRVADGTIYRVLEKLLILDGERLSYKALDVEQIGSVYEAMMGFELRVARGPSIALRPEHLVVDLGDVLAAAPTERSRLLKERAGCDLAGAALDALRSARSVEDLEAALARRRSPRTPRVLAPGEMYLQPTEERRRSGSHYTPRSLTEPIVRTTLRPIFEAMGERPTPDQILDLKVCDPAMGSGAFLVEACRLLGDRLVQAWNAHGGAPKLPPDEDPQLYARRIVAQRCLYGVDKNPFAVDLAKLSLWLATLARDHPFTFLDHALRCGDSLVGLTREQIACFSWEVGVQIPTIRPVVQEAVTHAEELRSRIQALAGSDDTTEKARLLKEAEDALDNVRLIGDLTTAAFFGAEKKKERERLRERNEAKVRGLIAAGKQGNGTQAKQELRALVQGVLGGGKPICPFHWEIEFPEVFSRDNPGFDAFVGNPPFAGKNSIRASGGELYIPFLQAVHLQSHGASDLVAHFFRRTFSKVRQSGTLGLIATNTVAQGDTRATGLRWICNNGGIIYEARKRYKWPSRGSQGAAVTVSIVYVFRGQLSGSIRLDGDVVEKITAYLFHAGGSDDPFPLRANAEKSFQGSIILGLGFTFDDTSNEATPLSEMSSILAEEPRYQQLIFPYIGGEEITESSTNTIRRYVINFDDMSEAEARQWPRLFQIVEKKVKQKRLGDNRESYRKYWWQFAEKRSALYKAVANLPRVLAISRVTQYLAFTFLPANMVFSDRLVVIALPSDAVFSLLQSRVHEAWALFLGATFEDRPTYASTDCFETFPFASNWENNEKLQRVGKEYYEFRANLMVRYNEGLTKTYNRFHGPDERDPDILKLRELHDAMDRAVLDAYAWTDLKPTCGFILDYEEEDEDEAGRPRKRKKPWRYRWPDEFRDEVLARLLALNQERAAQEKIMGTGPDGAKSRRKNGSGRRKPSAPDAGSLFE